MKKTEIKKSCATVPLMSPSLQWIESFQYLHGGKSRHIFLYICQKGEKSAK
jgi:hypothetical protein